MEALTREREKELAALEKAYHGQVASVNSRYDARLQDFQLFQQSGQKLVDKLNEDYQTMLARGEARPFTEDQVEKARKVVNTAGALGSEAKKIVMALADTVSDPKIKEAINFLYNTNFAGSIITSYMAADNDPKLNAVCVILTPVKKDSDKGSLADSLETKMIDALDISSAMVKPGVEIHYACEHDYFEDFAIFRIKPVENNLEVLRTLERFLARKISDKHIQPIGFPAANLVHVVKEMPFYELYPFLSSGETSVIIKPANRERKERRLNFASANPEEIRKEAYARLDAVPREDMSVGELANVMGMGYSRAFLLTERIGRTEIPGSGPKGKVYRIDKEKARAYLEKLRPTIKGWRKK